MLCSVFVPSASGPFNSAQRKKHLLPNNSGFNSPSSLRSFCDVSALRLGYLARRILVGNSTVSWSVLHSIEWSRQVVCNRLVVAWGWRIIRCRCRLSCRELRRVQRILDRRLYRLVVGRSRGLLRLRWPCLCAPGASCVDSGWKAWCKV